MRTSFVFRNTFYFYNADSTMDLDHQFLKHHNIGHFKLRHTMLVGLQELVVAAPVRMGID